MRIFTHRGRGWLAATAAVATLGLAASTHAQYAPYGAGQSQNGAGQVQSNPYATSQPQYAAQGAYQGYTAPQAGYAQPQYAQPQYSQPQTPAQPSYAQQQNYGPQYATPRVAMAFQGAGATSPAPTTSPVAGAENLTLTAPSESVPPGPMQTMPNGGYAPQPTPVSENYGAAAGTGMGYGGAGGYESYPAAGGNGGGYNAGYDNASGYGACDTSGYGCNTYSTYGGMGGALGKHAGCGYWFGGVYGLLMDRDNGDKYALAFAQPSMPDGSYPTPPNNVVLTSRDADVGFQPGVEFRLGRTFGCNVDPCNPCGSCGPKWGLEAVYWTLFDDDASAMYVDQAPTRTYMNMPAYGLEHDAMDGNGYQPMNYFWDYAPPSQMANPYAVSMVRVRSSLEVQNVELNLLRLGVCGGGWGAACGANSCAANSCDASASTGGCDSMCGNCATCAPRGSRYSCTAVCGVRWMQFDESFMVGADFYQVGNPANTGYANYWSTVENNLVGGQLGCNGMYRIGCKWGLHVNTLVGIYGNDINVRQYFNSTGNVRFIGTGENFDVMADKTDVAMLGELRVGASYQYSCHCRLYGGWRAIGVTGIALATDQQPNAYWNLAQMNNYVNSNGSMILHGLQAGVEFNY